MKKRTIALLLALVLVIGCVVGGTIAWLTDKTEEVKNTFSPSTIEIELEENAGEPTENVNEREFDMVPGYTITKDPKVTVKAVSEACLLFVQIDESDNFDSFMEYTIDTAWTAVPGFDDVYYCEVADTDADQVFEVLANNVVTVKDTVTTEMMNEEFTQPTLTFTAYAHQLYQNNTTKFDVDDAWENITASTTPAE